MGRTPPSKDGVAELILMDQWVQGQMESMPHWSRTWEAGNQVMLQADCKGKGWLKKLSKNWMGPYTIIEVHSPQVVVLEELNSRKWFTVNIEQIKPFNAATPTTLKSRTLKS